MMAAGPAGRPPRGTPTPCSSGACCGGAQRWDQPPPTPTTPLTHSALSVGPGSSPSGLPVSRESVAKISLKAIGPIHRFPAADELTQNH